MAQFGQFGRSVTLPTNKKGARVFRLDGTLVGTVWMFDGRLCCSSPRVPITATTTMRSVIRRLRRLAHTDTVGPERPYQGWFYGTKWVCRSCGQPEPTPGYVDPQTRQCSLCEDLIFDFRQDQINKLNEAMSDLRRQAIADACADDFEPFDYV